MLIVAKVKPCTAAQPCWAQLHMGDCPVASKRIIPEASSASRSSCRQSSLLLLSCCCPHETLTAGAMPPELGG